MPPSKVPENYLPKHKRPLKVLTLEGDGLQGIAQMMILKELLAKLAYERGSPGMILRPCDVFDVICGIGGGGCLALLLGRLQLGSDRALSEWERIGDTCERGNGDKPSRINKTKFEEVVRSIVQRTHAGDKLKDTSAAQKTCRHTSLSNGFPNQQNINEIAAWEIWALYGGAENVRNSIFVNNGPGPPHNSEIRKILGVHSWSKIPSTNFDRQVHPEGSVKKFQFIPDESVKGAIFGEDAVRLEVRNATSAWLSKHKVADTLEKCAHEMVFLESNGYLPPPSPPPPYTSSDTKKSFQDE
ncbi:hypothetical protein HYFRA_00009538 [Hymenoscyphus fraxineus]|uniref:PNPLA domain-containing protein n=1 Tax=Hymenoscyphus fraxineus TaxID=746836 RepID=A0A9N9KY15_9HELO|nr:hypothetical protein HYFRA_00009538 [Hymenoscyphus fraxineus]